jgi:TetR/AcrR family transcriptional repressor of nem operon
MPPQRLDTRIRIVQTALRLFASRGYYHTSIADVVRESGCTRGALYYHFSSKEELGYAAIDEELRLFAEEGAASHLYTNEHPIDRLLKALDALPSVTRLGTLDSSATDIAVRMASVHDGFRKRFQANTEALIKLIADMVRKGIADGQIADRVDPDQLAHIYYTVAGGIQFATLFLDREVIWEDTQRWIKDYLNSLRK